MSYNVGLNIVETDGKATPSIQPAQTSVAAFLILSERGIPGEVRQVVNWNQFKEYFGSHTAKANGAYAVQGFFDNGGTMAYVARMAITKVGVSEAACASVTGVPKLPIELTKDGLKLVVGEDNIEKEVKVDFSVKTPARITGVLSIALPENADDLNVVLKVNGVAQAGYTFNKEDFPGPEKTLEDLAKAIKREFTDIQAFARPEDGLEKLFIETDHCGVGASLELTGSLAKHLSISAVQGSGNITDINNADLKEVGEAILAKLEEKNAGLKVVVDVNDKMEQQITFRHSKPGVDSTIKIFESGSGTALGFKFSTTEAGQSAFVKVAGVDQVASAVAFAKPIKGLTLTINAGYMGQKDPGNWGNELAIVITKNKEKTDHYDLTVLLRKETVETWDDLDDIKKAAEKLNDATSGSKYIMIESAESGSLSLLPSRIALLGGEDDNLEYGNVASVIRETAELFDTKKVQLVCCPESSEDTVIDYLLGYCSRRGDCMFVGHTPKRANMESAKKFGKKFQAEKRYGALYFPWIQVYDPIPDGSNPKFIPPTGHVMGVYARTERERGIWKAPAGNAARISGALDVERHITDVEHTDLVKNAGVNAVRFIPGQGIIIDSSRTMSTSTLWLYVNVRLLFNFVKSSLIAGLRWVAQEPNNEALWKKIKYNTVTPFLMGLWRQGAFGPGKPEEVFSVKVDETNNKPADIQNGILTVEVYFYPSRPAETIIITVGQQEGGASANEN